MQRSIASTKKKSRQPNYSSGLPSSRGRYAPKQWMNYLTNLHIESIPYYLDGDGRNVSSAYCNAYQIPDLMVPPRRYKHGLPRFLKDLQAPGSCCGSVGVQLSIAAQAKSALGHWFIHITEAFNILLLCDNITCTSHVSWSS